MTYKCGYCGCVFEEGEERTYSSYLADMGSMPVYETTSECPNCGEDYEEAIRCEECGEYFTSDELEGGVCGSCIDDHRYDWETCYELSKECKETVEINAFLASVLTEEQINYALFKMVRYIAATNQIDCKEYIDADRSWFGEMLRKRG